jgi:hypothetical protein
MVPDGSLLKSKGLRLSVAGAVVVALSMPALIVMPDLIPGFAMMIGGLAVIGGFIWTLAELYASSADQPPSA